jgi:spore photoproduct lyase
MKIIHQKTKTLTTKDNGRSSDAVSPNFIYGCLGGCMNSYCYVGRYNHDKVYINENYGQILQSIHNWVKDKPWPKTPNQVDDKYYVIDIGCSTDVALMSKHYDWQENVFQFFNNTDRVKSTFATKYPSMFHPETYDLAPGKHRIRVSLMPQKYSNVLEPNTDLISDRIQSIPRLQKYMEVHINFSPIIYEEGWLDEYRKLFEEIKSYGIQNIKCECIFLTHNVFQHERNAPQVRDLLWKPDIQEAKDSQYAPDNIRYRYDLKREMIKDFTKLYSEYFNPSQIRYIF